MNKTFHVSRKSWRRHAWINWCHTVVLLCFMAGFLGLLGWLLWGGAGLLLLLGVMIFPFSHLYSSEQALRRYDAVLIEPWRLPGLWALLKTLSTRAGLARLPKLYYLPTPVANAFTVGSHNTASIAVTDGLLRMMRANEMAGVLAHEISHIRNGDLRVMALADIMNRAITICAQIGLLIAMMGLPLMLLGIMTFNSMLLALLIFAPYPAALAQLALSRVREYDADRLAVHLTGDPDGLANAIQKLDRDSGNWLYRILLPGSRHEPALLRTHPSSSRRIARLAKYQSRPASFINNLNEVNDFSEGYESKFPGSCVPRRFGRFRF